METEAIPYPSTFQHNLINKGYEPFDLIVEDKKIKKSKPQLLSTMGQLYHFYSNGENVFLYGLGDFGKPPTILPWDIFSLSKLAINNIETEPKGLGSYYLGCLIYLKKHNLNPINISVRYLLSEDQKNQKEFLLTRISDQDIFERASKKFDFNTLYQALIEKKTIIYDNNNGNISIN